MKLLVRDDKYRTQEQAIAYHNKRKESMLSMPDVFQLVKENNTEAIESLRVDFKGVLVTGSRIIYNKENLSAKIIHNADSTTRKPIEIEVKEIPFCNPTYLKELVETESGLIYLRALTNRKKSTKEKIIDHFVKLSGKKEKNIRFWTPSQSSRKDKQVRSVELYFSDFGRFDVVGYFWFGNDGGYSRGVIVDSAKQTKKIKGKSK